MQLGNYVI
jgi:hypothetical protein